MNIVNITQYVYHEALEHYNILMVVILVLFFFSCILVPFYKMVTCKY